MEVLLGFAERWGWLVTISVYFSWKLITASIDKYIPDALSSQRAAAKRKADRETTIEDRTFDLQEKTLTVIASNTRAIEELTREFNAHLGTLTRALDANTLVLSRVKAFEEAFVMEAKHERS
jgi:hypothetical protein